MFLDFPGLAGKWLPMLTEVAPGIRRVALVWDATTSPTRVTAAKAAAQGLAMDLQVVEIRSAITVEGSLTDAVKGNSKALVLLSSPTISMNSIRIADVMTKQAQWGSTSGRAESGASKEVG